MSSGGDAGTPARPRSSLWDGILGLTPWRRNSDTTSAPPADTDAGRADPELVPAADDQREPPAEGESTRGNSNSGNEDDDSESKDQEPESVNVGNEDDDNKNRFSLTYHVNVGPWHTEMLLINTVVVYSVELPITKNGRVLTFQVGDGTEGAGSAKQMFVTLKDGNENGPAKLYICFPKAQKTNEGDGEQNDNSQRVSPFIEIYYATPENDCNKLKLEEIEIRLEDGVLTINLPDEN